MGLWLPPHPQTPGAGGPADLAASAALPAPQPAFPGPGTAVCFGELLQVDAVGLCRCLASQAKQKLASWAVNLECALRVAASLDRQRCFPAWVYNIFLNSLMCFRSSNKSSVLKLLVKKKEKLKTGGLGSIKGFTSQQHK